jgi:ribosome production factor 1
MPAARFEPSAIRNKQKREDVHNKAKKAKGQEKLKRRLARAETEASDPVAKKV